MPTYRIYRLEGDGRISGAEWIEAADDQVALEQARKQARGSRHELWQGHRLVGRIAAEDAAPPPVTPPSNRAG